MKDRELLELAAKASGEVSEHWEGNQAYFDGVLSRWNPLENDGDALRLAVKLGMYINIYSSSMRQTNVGNRIGVTAEEIHGDDPYAATRRAIVKAAAAIAKMKGEE